MCGDCKGTLLCDGKIICWNQDSENYGKCVSKLSVCDLFEIDYLEEDMFCKIE